MWLAYAPAGLPLMGPCRYPSRPVELERWPRPCCRAILDALNRHRRRPDTTSCSPCRGRSPNASAKLSASPKTGMRSSSCGGARRQPLPRPQPTITSRRGSVVARLASAGVNWSAKTGTGRRSGPFGVWALDLGWGRRPIDFDAQIRRTHVRRLVSCVNRARALGVRPRQGRYRRAK